MTMKKLLALLTVLMMLTCSMAAFADSPSELVNKAYENGQLVTTTITGSLGTLPMDERIQKAVTDFFDSFKFELISHKGTDAALGQATIYFNEQRALSFSGMASDSFEQLFLSSSLLGDQVLYFTLPDVAGLYMRLMDMALSMDTTTSQGEKDEMMAMLQESMEVLLTQEPVVIDYEAMEDPIEQFALDLNASPKMAPVVERVTASAVVTEGTFESEDHDPATIQTTVTYTKEDLITCMVVLFETLQQNEEFMASLRSSFNDQMTVNDEVMTIDEGFETIKAGIPEAMAAFRYDNIPITALLNSSGEIVYATILYENVDPADPYMGYVYTRKTGDDGKLHMVQFDASYDSTNQTTMSMTFRFLEDSATQDEISFYLTTFEDGLTYSSGELSYKRTKDYGDTAAADHAVFTASITEAGQAMGFVINVDNQAAYDGTDVTKTTTIDLCALNDSQPLLGFQGHTQSVTADALVLPETAQTERLGSMTEDELNQWSTKAQVDLITGVQNLFLALPSSVLNVLMGQ